jgi:hypothetical protein
MGAFLGFLNDENAGRKSQQSLYKAKNPFVWSKAVFGKQANAVVETCFYGR